MDSEPWHVKRKRELEAAAPVKPAKAERFVKVPLWWIAAASNAARSPATIVLTELLYASWKAKNPTFPLPNGRLAKLGVSRDVKRRVLHDLELGNLIRVERRGRATPIVTMLTL